MRRLDVWIVVTLVLAGAAAPAVASSEVCFIEEMEGEPERLALRRGERQVPLAYYTPLQPGDVLEVGEPHGRIAIRCSAERIVVREADSPYIVAGRGAAPTRSRNLMAWLSEFFLDWSRRESVADLTVRDGRPSAPLLELTPAAVAAGRTILVVGLRGGKPPYSVRVFGADPQSPVLRVRIPETARAVVESAAPLAPGDYVFEVVDANRRELRTGFEVLAAATLPRVPAELRPEGPEDLVGRTLEAAWLASLDDGRFALEAYQRVAEIAHRHDAALHLSSALESGFLPLESPVR